MFTYKIELQPTKEQIKELEKRFKFALDLKYVLTRKVAKIHRTRRNHPLWGKIVKMTRKGAKKSELNPLYKQIEEETKLKFFNTKEREYQEVPVTKLGLGKYATHYANGQGWTTRNGGISADSAAGLAADVYKAFEKVMYGDGETIKTSRLTIDKIYVGNKPHHFRDGVLAYNIGCGETSFSLEIKAKMKNDDYEKEVFTNQRKTVSIQRRLIRGEYKYYALLTFEGTPPRKAKFAHDVKGTVGIDPGTSSIAVVADSDVFLHEIGSSAKDIEITKEIARLQRKEVRQRRANNPLRYDENGTGLSYSDMVSRGIIKQGEKAPRWVISKKHRETLNKIADLKRIQAARRNIEHKTTANRVVSLGDKIICESMSFKGLAARAKETKVSEKTGKFQRKSRFGSSILNSAPAMLQETIKYKAEYQGKEYVKANTFKIKASQYDHIQDEYIKPSLSKRTKQIGDHLVQRDLYAAFLLKNVIGDNADELDKESIARDFENFMYNHDATIKEMIESGEHTLKSLGLEKFEKTM